MHLFVSFLVCNHLDTKEREQAALLKLSSWCLVTVSDMWLFLTVPWSDLQCVIVVFPDHTHLLLDVLTSTFVYLLLLVTMCNSWCSMGKVR